MHQWVNTAWDKVEFSNSGYPIIQAKDITSGKLNLSDTKLLLIQDFNKYKVKYKPQKNNVLLSNIWTVWKSLVIEKDEDFIIAWNVFILKLSQKILPKYLKYCFDKLDIDKYWEQFMTWWTVKFINKKVISSTKIPLPPIEIQEQIVAELDNYQKIIDGAKQVVQNYKPTIKIDESWGMVELGNKEYIEIIDWDRWVNYPKKEEFSKEWFCLFLNTSNVRKWNFDFSDCDFISQERDLKLWKGKLTRWDLILTTRGTLWNNAYYDFDIKFDNIRINSWMVILRPNDKTIKWNYLKIYLNSKNLIDQIDAFVSWSAQPQLPIRSLSQFKIPLPSLPVQEQIVARIEEEQKMVDAAKGLIAVFEKKIEERISEVWGE